MKFVKGFLSIFLNHGISSILGWIAGLLVIQIINSFIEEAGFSNLWGMWSDKMVVEHSVYNTISWIATALVGWGISQGWQKSSSYLLSLVQKQS